MSKKKHLYRKVADQIISLFNQTNGSLGYAAVECGLRNQIDSKLAYSGSTLRTAINMLVREGKLQKGHGGYYTDASMANKEAAHTAYLKRIKQTDKNLQSLDKVHGISAIRRGLTVYVSCDEMDKIFTKLGIM